MVPMERRPCLREPQAARVRNDVGGGTVRQDELYRLAHALCGLTGDEIAIVEDRTGSPAPRP